jgi:hypothetical protein
MSIRRLIKEIGKKDGKFLKTHAKSWCSIEGKMMMENYGD